jgi:hypothetical protein
MSKKVLEHPAESGHCFLPLVRMNTISREQIEETLRECLQLLAGDKCPTDWNGDDDVLDFWGLDSQHGVELACDLASRLGIDIPLKDNPLIEDGDGVDRKRQRTFSEVVSYLEDLADDSVHSVK